MGLYGNGWWRRTVIPGTQYFNTEIILQYSERLCEEQPGWLIISISVGCSGLVILLGFGTISSITFTLLSTYKAYCTHDIELKLFVSILYRQKILSKALILVFLR